MEIHPSGVKAAGRHSMLKGTLKGPMGVKGVGEAVMASETQGETRRLEKCAWLAQRIGRQRV